MRPCLLTPRVESYLGCLLNQWEAWQGMRRHETAGSLESCLECDEGVMVLKEAAADIRSGHREPARVWKTWSKYRNEGRRSQAGTPAPPGTPVLPEWLGDATPAVRRAYLRETG